MTTTSLTLAQAAAETGLHRSSILRAIKRGTISGTRDATDQWTVEPVELFRVFPPAVRTAEPADATRQLAQPDTEALAQAHHALAQAEQSLSQMKAMLDDMRGQRDAWQAQAERLALPKPVEPAPASLWKWLRSTG